MGRFCCVCDGSGELDIVAELLRRAASYDLGGESSAHTSKLLRNAADEIVALRERRVKGQVGK